jgi:predicted nucleotidyltransferase
MKQASAPTKRLRGGTSSLARQPETLQELVRQMAAVARPLKIVLFGSRARGDAKLVMGISYDILVATPKDLERYGYHPSLVYKYILDEGVDLYVA